MESNNKKSFLDDLATEKPESFQEEVFIKSKRNYVPVIVFSTLAIAIFAILYFTFTKGAIVPDMTGWNENEIYAWANSNNATIVKNNEYTLDTEEGILIKQALKKGEKVRRNGTLEVTISKGADPNEIINFPDVKSMNLQAIENWIEDNHLQGVTLKEENSSVFEKDAVINYEFTDGNESKFLRKSRVKIYISLGQEELKDTISVPNFSGKTKGEVVKWANSNSINVEFSEDYNEYVDHGLVMEQSIDGNTKMKRDNTLSIALSLGEAIVVPNFLGLDRDEAINIAKLNDIELYFKNEISSKKEDSVIYQDIDAGNTIDSKTLITISIATTSDLVQVPDFIGLDQGEAGTLASVYNIRTFFVNKESTATEGQVIEQSHTGGQTISTDTLVTIYVSKGDLVIPNFIGLSKSEAELLIESMGLNVIYNEVPSNSIIDNEIIEQSLTPDSIIAKTDKIILSTAANNGVIIPDFRDMTRNEIETWSSVNETPVTFVEKYSNYVATGYFYDQSHENTYAPSDEAVLVYQSLGKIPVRSFIDQTKIDIQAWQKDVNEKGGDIKINIIGSTETTKPAGTVVNQSINNDFAYTGSTLDVWIAEANINNTIPDLVGLKEDKAIEWCTSNNINYLIVDRYNSDYPKERISGQNFSNQALAAGETLILYRSRGPLYIPSFVGQGKAAIVKWVNESNLEGGDISMDFTYVYSGKKKKDVVTQQNYERENIDVGSVLRVVLSAPEYVDIPDFSKMNLSDVVEILDKNDIKYETKYIFVAEDRIEKVPKDTVIGQSIEGEFKFQGHEPVVLTVSNGAKY